ncbi:MAG: YqgE/AlgH family protein [Roseovarius sp.]|uniref:YqgE/AlgH family protein n=1 Tax=Roseovarius sp. TaxID=1486281 RepID=UPI00405A281F
MSAPIPPPAPIDLTGKILIAMPGMGDPRFAHSVVYLCAHSAEGAMGLIVNKPAQDLKMCDLLEHLSITPGPEMRDMPVHFGGPVEHGRGFVLHDDGYRSDIATLNVAEGFGMTATLDILEDIAQGRGPEHAILALGYAGWGPEQLESELAENGWLTCDADTGLVFDSVDTDKWETALTRLGISSLTLSSDAGHA